MNQCRIKGAVLEIVLEIISKNNQGQATVSRDDAVMHGDVILETLKSDG